MNLCDQNNGRVRISYYGSPLWQWNLHNTGER